MAVIRTAAIPLCAIIVAFITLTADGCVPLDPGCQLPSTTPAITFFGDINSPVVIIAIVIGCIAAIVIILLLIWLCCWCCYRTAKDTDDVPSVIRRTVIVRQRQQQVAVEKPPVVKRIEVGVTPRPPPPAIQHPPSEKIVVVQPVAAPQPTSLLLTVSDGQNCAANGPLMTTCVEQPLKFTLTPEYVGQHAVTDLSVYEHINHGQPGCNCQLSTATCSCHHH